MASIENALPFSVHWLKPFSAALCFAPAFGRGRNVKPVELRAGEGAGGRLCRGYEQRFPQLTINHSVLLFAAKETDKEILFSVYDPNKPDSPKTLTYDRASRTFNFPGNDYWPGGRVDIYEIYRSWDY